MVQFKVGESGKQGTLKFDGELTIDNADENRQAFLDSITTVETISVNLEKVTKVDLTFLQLLFSAHRTSTAMNKRMDFIEKIPEPVIQSVKRLGFSYNKLFEFSK